MTDPDVPLDGVPDDAASFADSFAAFFDAASSASTAPPTPKPIVLHRLTGTERDRVLGELGVWLAWFLPTYRIPRTLFPYACWLAHTDVVEEALGLWLAWQATHHPTANALDTHTFNALVPGWRERVKLTYGERCKDGHQEPTPLPALSRTAPPKPSSAPAHAAFDPSTI